VLAHGRRSCPRHGRAARQDRRARHDRTQAEIDGKRHRGRAPYFSVKEAVFPFTKFPEARPYPGTGNEEHGEVMGTGAHLWRGLCKAQAASA